MPRPAPIPQSAAKVIVGLSGGVDSSVSALMLQQQGYQISALFMKNWEETDPTMPCPAVRDAHDALAVCEALGISLDAINLSTAYWEHVFSDFLAQYRAGRTPNPDILCNKEIKFKAFLDHALAQGADYIATGHYARIVQKEGYYRLLKAVDSNKDQTYFLYTLGQYALGRTLFPVGGLLKPAVRALAAQHGFVNHAKKDSTGICFIGERRFKKFLQQYLPAQPGDIRDETGRLLGQHEGLMYYTLGQRQGLGIGGQKNGRGDAWYVAEKILATNTLIAVQGHTHPALYTQALSATHLHFTGGTPPPLPLRCAAKTRYRQAEQACTLTTIENGQATVVFDQPQWAVTPGQSVVFYVGDECLGGGIIERAWKV